MRSKCGGSCYDPAGKIHSKAWKTCQTQKLVLIGILHSEFLRILDLDILINCQHDHTVHGRPHNLRHVDLLLPNRLSHKGGEDEGQRHTQTRPPIDGQRICRSTRGTKTLVSHKCSRMSNRLSVVVARSGVVARDQRPCFVGALRHDRDRNGADESIEPRVRQAAGQGGKALPRGGSAHRPQRCFSHEKYFRKIKVLQTKMS
jgi:hypothetical protein